MVKYKPVSLSKASFAFCRYSMALMVWISFFLQSQILLGIVFLIFLLNAFFKVKRAPMIRLYDVTFNRIKRAPEILVNENSLFFAHSLAAAISCICLVLVLTVHNDKIWYSVLAFALLKTVSAFGICPASRLYECWLGDNCCMKKE